MFYLILFLFIFLTFTYASKILSFYFGLSRLKSGKNKKMYSVSILVPARNEEDHISRCLDSLISQDYSQDILEIIVIDDDSQDRTAEIVQSYCSRYPFLRFISLNACPPGVSPKKRALQVGVEAAEGEIIFTTDADCWMSPRWISRMVTHFEAEVGMVVGYVAFAPKSEKTMFHKLQSIEFIGLTTAGIGSIGSGDPIIANGANLAFRKSTFKEVDGYRGTDHVISGDDDLLLQKINQNTNWNIRAAVAPDTIVLTQPISDLNAFMNQRIRWASKSLVYKKASLVWFLISTYILYLLLFVSIPISLRFLIYYPYPIMALLIKIGVDFLLIWKGTTIVKRQDLRKYFLAAELFQIPYVLYVGFAGILGQFEWKGR